jgi:hypothetical protein
MTAAGGASGAAGTTGVAGSTDAAGTTGVAGANGAAGSRTMSGIAGTNGAADSGTMSGGAGTGGDGGAPFDTGSDDSGVVVTDPGTMGDGDFMIGPTYTKAPELTVDANTPHGTVTGFTIASTESPIFAGVTGPYTRQGWIYVPKQYVKGTPAPFIIAQDGRDYMSRLPAILDNMIAAKRVSVMIAVMVMAGPGDGPGSDAASSTTPSPRTTSTGSRPASCPKWRRTTA